MKREYNNIEHVESIKPKSMPVTYMYVCAMYVKLLEINLIINNQVCIEN